MGLPITHDPLTCEQCEADRTQPSYFKACPEGNAERADREAAYRARMAEIKAALELRGIAFHEDYNTGKVHPDGESVMRFIESIDPGRLVDFHGL